MEHNTVTAFADDILLAIVGKHEDVIERCNTTIEYVRAWLVQHDLITAGRGKDQDCP